MSTPPAPAARPRLAWRQLRLSSKLLVVAVPLLLLTAGLEVSARFYWWRVKGVAVVGQEALWRTAYVELPGSGIDDVAPHHADDAFDVLLLGGSVLHHSCGDVGPRLQPRMQEMLKRPVRVVNIAYPGRTSCDSRMKYARLEDRRFDLVVFYHGINDAFLNNCRPGTFRADYSSVRHIAQMRALQRHPEVRWLALPYTARYIALNLADRWDLLGGPRHRHSHFGGDLRTPPAFEANLEAVVATAARRGDPLLLATFAYHLPANYTEEDFQAGRLDYDRPGCPARTWGEPAHLARAIDAHNAATRRVAARHGTLFADVAQRLPGGRLCFRDPCHFNAEGCRRWVELIVEAAQACRKASTGSTRAARRAG
jgi:hypothetical protein